MSPARQDGDYFALFGLERRFAVSQSDLEERHRKLSRAVHPDRFAGADPRTRRIALEQSTRINEAYQTLRDPVRRARYLLLLAGVLKSSDDAELGQAPPQFLMEMMELRERLASAGREEQTAILQDLEVRKKSTVEAIGEDFESAEIKQDALESVRRKLAVLKYIDSILRQYEERPELR